MDPFRAHFLRHVRHIITNEPGKEALHNLLGFISPELTEQDVADFCKRNKAFKELKLRIHPDKHPNDNSVTALFQDVQKFFDACCRILEKKKKPASKRSVTSFPTEFKVYDKWPFMNFSHPVVPNREALAAKKNTLNIFMAYRCINARAAIAHGAQPSLIFDWQQVLDTVGLGFTTEKLFSEKYKGAKRLEGVDDIKEELTTRGPVVSTSFVLSQSFANTTEFAHSFSMERIKKNHPLLIVGWKLTAFGEVWLVLLPYNDSIASVAFGQFGIDDMCLAPESKLENMPCQSGPFLDLDMSGYPKDWRTWSDIELYLSSSELESLSTSVNAGFVAAKEKKTRFVICDKNKLAHSRACNVKDIQWKETKKKWLVSIQFLIG